MAIKRIAREQVALALNASIVEPQPVTAAFDQSAIEVPRYAAVLPMVAAPTRINDFRKGSAARINDGFGYPTFAELIVAARLRTAGWDSVWVSPFGRLSFVQDWPWNVPEPALGQLPEYVMERLAEISELRRLKRGEQKANFNGILDVIGWRRDDLIMIECKRANADRLRPNQEEWIHCAILSGCKIEELGVFEWQFDRGD
jgi:hypothetical protein